MSVRLRSVKSVKEELIKKSREAILAAVQMFNNPLITFKTETFITLTIIAWTYLLHAYYRGKSIEYRYFKEKGSKKQYDKTKHGADKFWELEKCLDYKDCPLDDGTKNNLRFLIGIRHEIEHQMTNQIDEYIGAKLQACALNYDFYINKLFGEKYSVSRLLAMSIQFSEITPSQRKQLLSSDKLIGNVRNFISEYENSLSVSELKDNRYAYRVLYTPVNVNHKGQADNVFEFVKADSQAANEIQSVLIKEMERTKYIPSEIVAKIQSEGFAKFRMPQHTEMWKANDARDPEKHYGTLVSKQWYWYESWLEFVRNKCQ
ncbi:MAG: hypothetical protein FD133_376, partial [Erysipelotrichaceae bacterium]